VDELAKRDTMNFSEEPQEVSDVVAKDSGNLAGRNEESADPGDWPMLSSGLF
jgi:hypothetical protein